MGQTSGLPVEASSGCQLRKVRWAGANCQLEAGGFSTGRPEVCPTRFMLAMRDTGIVETPHNRADSRTCTHLEQLPAPYVWGTFGFRGRCHQLYAVANL